MGSDYSVALESQTRLEDVIQLAPTHVIGTHDEQGKSIFWDSIGASAI